MRKMSRQYDPMQILLLVMNTTVSDVTDDELQLLAVEELLPLSGPSSVSVFGRRQETNPPTPSGAAAPSGSRKLLAGQLINQTDERDAQSHSDT